MIMTQENKADRDEERLEERKMEPFESRAGVVRHSGQLRCQSCRPLPASPHSPSLCRWPQPSHCQHTCMHVGKTTCIQLLSHFHMTFWPLRSQGVRERHCVALNDRRKEAEMPVRQSVESLCGGDHFTDMRV